MPFLLAVIRCMARSHLLSGMCERSITVPTVMVKGLRHSLHLYTPGRVLLPWSLVMRTGSALPQWRQIGPCGHRSCSRCSRASTTVVIFPAFGHLRHHGSEMMDDGRFG